MDFSQLRNEFRRASLSEAQAASDPIRQFSVWFEQALAAQCPEPNAMSLATVSAAGRPANRIVYLKGIESGDFLFFTNYQSRKGRELAENPWVSAVLFWPELERQVRIEGRANFVTPQESDAYFATRPRESRWGAWTSHQSQVIADRTVLDQTLDAVRGRYQQEVPRPPHWGGYRIEPAEIEFWQGRPGRLHDRLRYRRQQDQWHIERLSP